MTRNIRAGLLFGFGALASLAFFAANSDAKPETIAKIADGVWFREGDLENLGHCNNIVIEMKDYLIVVDANFPAARGPRWLTRRNFIQAGEVRVRHASPWRPRVREFGMDRGGRDNTGVQGRS